MRGTIEHPAPASRGRRTDRGPDPKEKATETRNTAVFRCDASYFVRITPRVPCQDPGYEQFSELLARLGGQTPRRAGFLRASTTCGLAHYGTLK